MLALVFGLCMAVIFTGMWYVGLKKRRESAIEALKLIRQKIHLRLDLLRQDVDEKRLSWSAKHQFTFKKLLQREDQSAWNNMTQQQLDSTTLSQWQKLDTDLTDFVTQLDDQLLSADTRQAQSQLAQDIEQVQGFYNHTVNELNSGVNIIPCAVVSKVTNIEPLPTFKLQTA
ncbi:hypothetical protein ACFOD0_15330 [Shewanella intestini]|uniref:LemA family protein n=1 Tax=Shewanella intestini TaxID=2017544 RepID=A0ABS5I6H1_9GAMM|nr:MULTISPECIES: hypothetical protein [Shewanella]MBR9729627.1 hypothetical protein [Shewanella intestini]